jgi:IMP dehydrogenase/GMP reductase
MKNIEFKFDFDDILIVPAKKTHISSRYNGIKLTKPLPLITAPMDTVVNLENMGYFFSNGISVALPRTIKYQEFKNFCTEHSIRETDYTNTFFSFGFNDLDVLYKNNFKELHENAHILIDVANGHMQKIVDYCREIKRLRPDIIIMVGNIANPETYRWYAEYGCVDYIRIGIGNGNGCLTTKQSGIGYPMASLIHEIRTIKNAFEKGTLEERKNPDFVQRKAPAIVADGGMKDYSDIIKSLALGADYVMIGSIFNKAFESAADNYLYGIKLNRKLAKKFFDKGYPIKKYFRGMSTKEAQKAMGKTSFKTSEGVVRFRRVEYYLDGWVENFEHYLRNLMSYVNAKTLEEFVGKVKICQISKNAYDRFNK